MAKDVIMPVLGMNQDTAVLLAWLKQEGDRVEAGEPIMEVETDKATMELDAPASGTLAGLRAAAGDEVKAGSVIAVILADGESATNARAGGAASDGAVGHPAPDRVESILSAGGASAPSGRRDAPREPAATSPASLAGATAGAASSAPAVTAGAVSRPASGAAGDGVPATGIVPASPKARRLAAASGVALETLRARGTGPDGAVLAADVLRAARQGAAVAPGSTGAKATVAALRFERVLDAGTLLATVRWARDRVTVGGAGLDVGDLVARFVMAAWSRNPVAGTLADATLRYRRIDGAATSDVALGVTRAANLPAIVRARAAATPAASEGPRGDTAVAALALLDLSRARADLTPDSVGTAGTLVEVVVGRLEERVLAVDGEPAVTTALRLGFAFDPARVDVAEAASFCDRVIALVEEPAALVLLY